MNELVKEASGKTMNEVLEMVIGRGSEVIRYETGRALMFQPDNTYLVLDGDQPASDPIDGPLTRVRDGETMLRNLITEDEGIYSGLQPERLGGTVNEAITPIRGKAGVIGALCLGRRGNAGFSQQDLGALDDLGSMAGVAAENWRSLSWPRHPILLTAGYKRRSARRCSKKASSGARCRFSTTRSANGPQTTIASSRRLAIRASSPCATQSCTKRTSAASGSSATYRRRSRRRPRVWI